MKKISSFLILFYTVNIHSQTLKIGDSIPDQTFHNVYNYPSDSLNISDFKGKLVLLEFWGFNCLSCVQGFPKLAQLQKDFAGKLQIILINPEKKSSMDSFFRKRIKVTKPDVPYITEDSFLSVTLRTKFTPANVWLDQSGKILYLADKYNATHENIAKLLEGQALQIPMAKPIEYVESLFDDKYLDVLESYYYLSRYIENLRLEPSNSSNSLLSFETNSSIQLYQQAFNGLVANQVNFTYPGRTIIKNYPKEKYQKPKAGKEKWDWLQKNGYYFQLFCKSCNDREKFERMLNVLNDHFHFKASIEKRKVNGWALVSLGSFEKLKTNGGKPGNNFIAFGLSATAEDSIRYIRNQPFKYFAGLIQNIIEREFGPFQNLVKYNGNIDFQVDGDVLDKFTIASFKKELNKYGLDLVETKMIRDVLIIDGRERR